MRWRWALAVYLVLLATSYGVRIATKTSPEPAVGVSVAEVPAVVGRDTADGVIRLAWRDWGSTEESGRQPVVLFHGSPGSSRDFRNLGPALGRERRVLAPDLPGFGDSEHRVPDYSIRAHARYTLDLMDELELDRVHLLGFSMGGGVALELIDQAPERVASLTLLSAIGVQELELLGSHFLNHAVHGLQLGAIRLLHYGVPHFGALDDSMLSVEYARNFYDSDQRPLRGVLEKLEVPLLVVHGRRDILVPVAAAREHHRLVPQSELVELDESHFMVFGDGERLSAPIGDFLDRVEAGSAATREDAEARRLSRAQEAFDPTTVPAAEGVTLLVLMFLLAVATLVSEDLACIAGGLLVAQGRIGFFAATLACLVGIFVGDMLLFAAGRFLGRPWLNRAPLKWIVTPERVEASSQWFERRGAVVVFLTRFLPGTRLPTYVAAGILRTSFWRFLGYFLLAVTLWTPLLVGLAALLGTQAFRYFEVFQRWALPGFLLLAIIVWLVVSLARQVATHRGRRRLRGWWERWRRWEFWPLPIFYTPVVLYVLWQGLRHRSPTLFTAANPAMPASGFIGESKSAILGGLPPDDVARFRLIPRGLPPTERLAAVRSFVETEGLELPVVLKPDVGERGTGVRVVRTWAAAAEHLALLAGDTLVQEYVPGPELGVFYVRLPGEPAGRIFSVTEKHLPTVTGNGTSSLEDLVLDDDRAVVLASPYLDAMGARREEVPAAGEIVPLTDLGTHCRGAVFLDGRRFATPEMTTAIDETSRAYPGFYFGRYDLKAPTEQDFMAGSHLKILELNGVTSEATHIYDPTNRLWSAYRTLFEQWRLAFEVGRRNRDLGTSPVGVRHLLRLWLGTRG